MKKITNLLLVFSLIVTSISAWAFNSSITNECSELKIKKFNYSDDVSLNGNIDSYWFEKTNAMVYFIPMKNSTDILLAYDNGTSKELTPFVFINMESNKSIYKDINNRKIVLALYANEYGDFIKSEYFEKNDSKKGYALALAGGCLGGSTVNCIDIAVTSCFSDAWCAATCGITWKYCLGSIALSCAVACNIQ